MYNSKDTLMLRLHFYQYDSIRQLPGDELLSHEIILKETKHFGWLRFDLRDYNIVLNTNRFFVGFEWIEDHETRKRMLFGLREWEIWKKEQYESGNTKVQLLESSPDEKMRYKYHGNMMDWPGFKKLPPLTGLMIETGKNAITKKLRTFERKTSFGTWKEMDATLNVVVTVGY